MNSVQINSFLESSILVFEQMCQIRPQVGQPAVKAIQIVDGHLWLKISIVGDMQGEVYYGFPRQVALHLVSGMMGGMVLTELDELGHSAIAELGNMICGNAGTILYGHGLTIDITPPVIVPPGQSSVGKAILVPLCFDGLGDVELYMKLNQAG